MSKKIASSDFGLRGSAARKLAIESLLNIANVYIGGDSSSATVISDEEFAPIIEVLRKAKHPVTVGVLAKQLPWDSTKTAEVLARAGQSGLLEFAKDGDTTTVAISGTNKGNGTLR
jgi:hypothetical protein